MSRVWRNLGRFLLDHESKIFAVVLGLLAVDEWRTLVMRTGEYWVYLVNGVYGSPLLSLLVTALSASYMTIIVFILLGGGRSLARYETPMPDILGSRSRIHRLSFWRAQTRGDAARQHLHSARTAGGRRRHRAVGIVVPAPRLLPVVRQARAVRCERTVVDASRHPHVRWQRVIVVGLGTHRRYSLRAVPFPHLPRFAGRTRAL